MILKPQEELDNSKWSKYTCFNTLMTQSSVVNYLINIDKQLLNTYEMYQNILYSIKNNKYNELKVILNNKNENIFSYMKKTVKTLKGYLPYIKNTLSNPYHNGFVESNNIFIKVLKRIAFGFKSFHRFKARIMICKNLLHMRKANA